MKIEVKDIEKMVFVATCPRSGSSMDCGILELCGAFGGKTIGSVESNTKGLFENRGLNMLLLSPIFEAIGTRSPRALLTFSKLGGIDPALFDTFEEDITLGLNRQGYKGGVAYFKNGIYTFFFDHINKKFPDAVWVLPYCNKDRTVASSSALNGAKPLQKIIDEVADYYEMYDHISEVGGDRVRRIDNDALVKGDFSQMKDLIASLGLSWDQQKVKDWVDPSLWSGIEKKGAQYPRNG